MIKILLLILFFPILSLAEDRIALVIGDSAIKTLLETMQFTVIYAENPNLSTMENYLQEFYHRIQIAETALFYFKGRSYLIDQHYYLLEQHKRKGIPLEEIIDIMYKNENNIIILNTDIQTFPEIPENTIITSAREENIYFHILKNIQKSCGDIVTILQEQKNIKIKNNNFNLKTLSYNFSKLTFSQRIPLIDALLTCKSLESIDEIEFIIRQLENKDITNTIEYASNKKLYLTSIIDTLLSYPCGLQKFITILRYYEGNSFAMKNVDKVLQEITQEY